MPLVHATRVAETSGPAFRVVSDLSTSRRHPAVVDAVEHRDRTSGPRTVDDPLLARLGAVMALTPEQETLIRQMQGRTQKVAAHSTIRIENETAASAYAVRSGWMFSYRILANGDRQVVDILLPGDIIGLGTLFLESTDLSFDTITDTDLVEIVPSAVLRGIRTSPELVQGLFAIVSQERERVVQHLVDVGRLDSVTRSAFLLLELSYRLSDDASRPRTRFACPLTQFLLADTLGLTAVHVNRVLRKLRVSGLLTFRQGHVTLHDIDRLQALTGFQAPNTNRVLAAGSGSPRNVVRHRS